MIHTNILLLCLLGLSVICFTNNSFVVGNEAIISGDKAGRHQFPYQVLLRVHGRHECGGGIIGDKYILSAAHCVVKNDGSMIEHRMSIFAGTNTRFDMGPPGVMIGVKRIFLPRDYDPWDVHTNADIAVLMLKENLGLSFRLYLKALKLPPTEDETYGNKTADIAGFGWDWINMIEQDKEIGGLSDGQLRFAKTDIFSHSQCQQLLEFNISHKQICARVKQRDNAKSRGTCVGDSGGPLVRDQMVIGVLSVSPLGCSEEEFVSIYTCVSDYRTFIEDSMNYKHSKHHKSIRMIELYYGTDMHKKPTTSTTTYRSILH